MLIFASVTATARCITEPHRGDRVSRRHTVLLVAVCAVAPEPPRFALQLLLRDYVGRGAFQRFLEAEGNGDWLLFAEEVERLMCGRCAVWVRWFPILLLLSHINIMCVSPLWNLTSCFVSVCWFGGLLVYWFVCALVCCCLVCLVGFVVVGWFCRCWLVTWLVASFVAS